MGSAEFMQDIVEALWDLLVFSVLAVYYVCESTIKCLTPASLRYEKSLKDKSILITGAAGGVGHELCPRLLALGAKIVAWDISEESLKRLKEACQKQGYNINTCVVDITDRNEVYKYADFVKREFGQVDILINNAGIVTGNKFLACPDHMIEKTYQVNILAHYWMVKAFLPDMMARRDGHIVTMSSLTGLLGTYNCTDYSASKFATLGFHESLLSELKADGFDCIKMTVICPYFINTGMFEGCKPRYFPMLVPAQVAQRMVDAIRREEEYVSTPTWGRYVLPLKHFMPDKLAWEAAYRLLKHPQAMMGMRPFKG